MNAKRRLNEEMFIEKYKNILLQNHTCPICNKVWDNYGEEVLDNYSKKCIIEFKGTIIEICPLCQDK
jgi:hypothetical protein